MLLNRINFGCGSVQPDGWLNIDSDPVFNTEIVDVRGVANNTMDYIVAHHVLETIKYHELPKVLMTLYDILKPGGVLRVSIPDILKAFEAYRNNDINWFPNIQEKNIDIRFSSYLSWYSQNLNPMTDHALAIIISNAGFQSVGKSYFMKTEYKDQSILDLDTRENESVFIEAVK